MRSSSADYFASIDIGTSNIVILVAQKLTNGKLRIVAKSCIATKPNTMVRGEIKNIEIIKSIKEGLDEISKNYGLSIKSAYVGLSGQHIVCEKHTGNLFIRNSEGAVEEHDIDNLMASMRSMKFDPGKDVISILPQTYVLDSVEHTNPIGMLGNRLEGIFNIVIGDKENITLFSRILKKVNVSVSNLLLSSIASSRAVLIDGEKELGVMVVDIGAGTTDISIYYDNNLKYMGVIPIGGNIINRDIKTTGILEKYVEKLKVCYGNAMSSTVDPNLTISLPPVGRTAGKEVSAVALSNIIEARLMDIITFLTDILNTTGLKNKLTAGIVLTGGGANIKNIDKLFEQHFDCQIRIASPTEYVDEDYFQYIEDPIYSTAVGLLLEGQQSGEQSVVELFKEEAEVELVVVNAPEETLFPENPIQEDVTEIPACEHKPDEGYFVEDEQEEQQGEDGDSQEDESDPKDKKTHAGFFDKIKKSIENFIYEK